jgi:hypothetical protein
MDLSDNNKYLKFSQNVSISKMEEELFDTRRDAMKFSNVRQHSKKVEKEARDQQRQQAKAERLARVSGQWR